MKHVALTKALLSFAVFAGTQAQAGAPSCAAALTSRVFEKDQQTYLRLTDRDVWFKELPGNEQMPQLVVLPGVNRALKEEYLGLQLLHQDGFPLLLTATSRHWQSLGAGDGGRGSLSTYKEMGLNEFAAETVELIKEKSLQRPVLLTLSYSSAIADLIPLPKIYVAPLIENSDANPAAAATEAQLEAWARLNPFFSEAIIRTMRDNGYRQQWNETVNNTLNADRNAYGPNADKTLIVEGYRQITKATEDFNLVKRPVSNALPQAFILGEKEFQIRLKKQVLVATNSAKVTPTRLIFIRRAEHNVTETQPQAYRRAVYEMAINPGLTGLQVGVIDPAKNWNEIEWLNEDRVHALFDHISKMPDSTDQASFDAIFGG